MSATHTHEPGNEEGPAGKRSPLENTQQHHYATAILTSMSTDTDVQLRKMVELLKMGGHDTYACRRNGISHPAGRVRDLIKRGFDIQCARITTIDENGFRHVRVAFYTLVSMPEGGAE